MGTSFAYREEKSGTVYNFECEQLDVSYGYDLLGGLTSASQSGHALAFTYDPLGRLLSETGLLGTVASEWDLAGRRTKLTWPDSFYVT